MVGKNGGQGRSSKNLITDDGPDTMSIRSNNVSAEPIPETGPNEIRAKHQILSAEDIRHFMQPHLPPSNSISSSCSTDAYANDANTDRFIRDKTIFYMSQLSDLQEKSKIIQPRCCCIRISTVSIGSSLITGALLLVLVAYVVAHHLSDLSDRSELCARLTGTLIAISALLLIFIGLFIGGILRRRKRWLLPLILSMKCLCVALFGTLVAMMITVTDDAEEEFAKHPNEHILDVFNIFIFRFSLLILLALGIFVTVCYIRCYRYISLLRSEAKHFVLSSAR